MNIHEYQAKALLATYGVAVPRGGVAYTPDEAVQVAQELGGDVWVVKSQIHAGGRGAGRFANDPDGDGGVRLAKNADEVKAHATAMLGQTLVTKQTGPMASTEGGMDIETVAHDTPEKILTVAIDPVTGLMPFHAREIAFGLGLSGDQIKSASKLLSGLYTAFADLDASLVEVNPLVVTGAGEVIALDAKMNFDDNALYRQPEVLELRDEDEEDPMELEASKHDLNYIKLDGAIGCMVNGAGLAMATMDIIKLYGSQPANFLDVGGAATKERVTAAFKIILSDPNVEGIMVNIFGGIMRCDVIAEGVVAAAREVALHVPLVVRLEGTNVDLGKQILADSGLPIVAADNLADAAEKVVNAVREAA
jgi:succinyl-CoA synthetase beta subunit